VIKYLFNFSLVNLLVFLIQVVSGISGYGNPEILTTKVFELIQVSAGLAYFSVVVACIWKIADNEEGTSMLSLVMLVLMPYLGPYIYLKKFYYTYDFKR